MATQQLQAAKEAADASTSAKRPPEPELQHHLIHSVQGPTSPTTPDRRRRPPSFNRSKMTAVSAPISDLNSSIGIKNNSITGHPGHLLPR
ncbi:unnamed protein product [Lactuca virosa]|uniref:Uncharacterized protein n=1 Tax=Lactuca virosa TaxID=75947 RepID=A0AAU9NCF6_9ASTR|nr:unnamed protein product [Lactuca virosa]